MDASFFYYSFCTTTLAYIFGDNDVYHHVLQFVRLGLFLSCHVSQKNAGILPCDWNCILLYNYPVV